MRQRHDTPGFARPAEIPRRSHLLLVQKGRAMDSWYISLVPASLAVAIIGYSLFIAYA